MTLFRNKLFLAITVGHFTIDIFSNMLAVVVAYLSVPLALTTAQIGLVLSAYQLFNAASQPFFGWLTDKIGSRLLGPGSLAWTAAFFSLAVLVAQTSQSFSLVLICFSIAALGIGAFHPLGTMHAATTSTERAATGTAVFFLFGQSGLASGPILAGIVLDSVGVWGIYGISLLSLPWVLFMLIAMRHTSIELPLPSLKTPASQPPPLLSQLRWGAIGLLALIVGLRSWAFLGTAYFLPTIFQAMGWQATAYGLITGIFWMSSAIMGVVAGHWADRWGRRQVVSLTLLLGTISLYFLPLDLVWLNASLVPFVATINLGLGGLLSFLPQQFLSDPAHFLLAVFCGGLLGASHSILVVIAQSLLPGSKSFASGLTLGYLFGVGSLATWVIGHFAEWWGLTFAIQLGAGFGLASAVLALVLPATKHISPSISPEPASISQSP